MYSDKSIMLLLLLLQSWFGIVWFDFCFMNYSGLTEFELAINSYSLQTIFTKDCVALKKDIC